VLRYGSSLYKPFLKVGLEALQETLDETNLGKFSVSDIDLSQVNWPALFQLRILFYVVFFSQRK